MLVAEGLRKLLEGEFQPVAIADSETNLVSEIVEKQPEIVLLDLDTPGGLDLSLARITEIAAIAKVIIVTMHHERDYVVEAFRAGASGYVLKRCGVPELLTAFRQVISGHSYVTPFVAQHVVAAATDPRPRQNHTLTFRQREVLELVAEGFTAKQIATSLQISVKTAVFHKMAIMDKLGIRTTAELTRYAIEHGIARSTSERSALVMDARAS